MTNFDIGDNLLIKDVEEICTTKNIICIITRQTHWTFFEFVKKDGTSIKYEMNWSYFLDNGPNTILRKIKQVLSKL